jgi:hypothetical protein
MLVKYLPDVIELPVESRSVAFLCGRPMRGALSSREVGWLGCL